MPDTARPAVHEVRNSSKDVSPLMVDGRVLYMLYVLMLMFCPCTTHGNPAWTSRVSDQHNNAVDDIRPNSARSGQSASQHRLQYVLLSSAFIGVIIMLCCNLLGGISRSIIRGHSSNGGHQILVYPLHVLHARDHRVQWSRCYREGLQRELTLVATPQTRIRSHGIHYRHSASCF